MIFFVGLRRLQYCGHSDDAVSSQVAGKGYGFIDQDDGEKMFARSPCE